MSIKKYLNNIGVRPSKGLGQNFLIDPKVVEDIFSFGAPKKTEKIIEVGGGTGVLTEYLADYDLTVIEIEENLAEQLKSKFSNAKIINEDVRFVDFTELGTDLVVYGNLPYSFSTDIILHVIEFRKNINRCIFMLQKEFSRRLAGVPGTKAYGTLSINTQVFADVNLGRIVTGDCFYPTTEVESQIVEIRFRDKDLYDIHDKITFQQMLSFAFSKRRKKISNALSGFKKYSNERIKNNLQEAGIDLNDRAEDISIESFVKLANLLA